MLLAIDVGNTRVKAAVFEKDTLLAKATFGIDQFGTSIQNILQNHPQIENMVVASVGKTDTIDFSGFENVPIHFIRTDSPFPFQNAYGTPATLGIDRLVLAAGAVLSHPGKNRLVIDAGTCVTYDFIDQDDTYRGGAISPGIRLRYEALHTYTARLPLLSRQEPQDMTGTTTNESIHSGVVNGLALEIDGFAKSYCGQYENFIIILTGGDADFLAKRLKNTIFANQNFLLESLNQLYQYIKNDQKN